MSATSEENEGRAASPVPFFRLEIIRKRAEFKAANGGARFSAPGFTALRAPKAGTPGVRFGFTVTKKLGKAVLRNRVRRRLRAAARGALGAAQAQAPLPAMDIVLLARASALDLPFTTLSADLRRALEVLARKESPKGPRKPPDAQTAEAKAMLGKTPPLP